MDNEIVDRLRSMQGRKIEHIILYIMSLVPGNKYIADRYITGVMGDKMSIRNIQGTLSQLVKMGLIERYSLLQYRRTQENHDRDMTEKNDENMKIFASLGFIAPGRKGRFLADHEIEAIKKRAPAELKKQLGWMEDIKTEGKEKMADFANDHVVGSVNLGKNPTQSVFRITGKGSVKLAAYQAKQKI